MAENLNYAAEGSKCSNNLDSNCDIYGRLYSWSTALTVCPSGWHLPTREEWEVMTTYIGGESTEGKMLKATSGWNNYEGKSGNGTDNYGFSALPGAGSYNDGFGNVGSEGVWWSADEHEYFEKYAYCRGMNFASENANWIDFLEKSYLLSVRCIKD